jgi:hypothetical protein
MEIKPQQDEVQGSKLQGNIQFKTAKSRALRFSF